MLSCRDGAGRRRISFGFGLIMVCGFFPPLLFSPSFAFLFSFFILPAFLFSFSFVPLSMSWRGDGCFYLGDQFSCKYFVKCLLQVGLDVIDMLYPGRYAQQGGYYAGGGLLVVRELLVGRG